MKPYAIAPRHDAPALVLASGSAIRRTVLENAGLAFTVDVSAVDEDEVKRGMREAGASTEATAEALAELKATRVSLRHPDALVIGCDQMLDLDGIWFDKPADRDHAFAHLKAMAGKTHRLVGAIVVLRHGKRIWHHVAAARLTMRPLSDAFINDYLDAIGDAATKSVGAYQLEGLGAQLFTRIDGDYFTVLGLSLLPLLNFLRGHGIVRE
ncbi:MAG: Maf family protein [Dokdonella sp.]|nr:Maf family protein [Dokdonella sp.]